MSEPANKPATGKLRKCWEATIRLEASDLLLRTGAPVRLRMGGGLKVLEIPPFTEGEFQAELDQLLSVQQQETLHTEGSVDLAYDFNEDNRFRVNVFRTRHRIALAARRVSSKIRTYEQLLLPAQMAKIPDVPTGLVILCGSTSSGKSTTIAAMIQQINESRACHIVTIEDPIEYIFKDAKATVNQREIGIDVPSFNMALRALVRENPDVVLIGEMRDRATLEAALQAAETGHMVFGTLHASSAAQAFVRIYNLFPHEERDLIREMLAQAMRSIVYQQLIPSTLPQSPRVPAVEVLMNNAVVRKYILEGREVELPDVIRTSQEDGMIDYSGSLVNLVNKEYISTKMALTMARNPEEVKMRLKGIVTSNLG